MLEIYIILYTLLEKNATLEALVDFKRALIADIERSVDTVSKMLAIQPERAREFFYASMSLITGTYPLMKLTPKQKEATKLVGIEMPPEKVINMLESAILSLLKGMLN